MSRLNKIEEGLCNAVEAAKERYVQITENWLFHAPEHFLQNFILLDLANKGYEVYAEATRKKYSNAKVGRQRVGHQFLGQRGMILLYGIKVMSCAPSLKLKEAGA